MTALKSFVWKSSRCLSLYVTRHESLIGYLGVTAMIMMRKLDVYSILLTYDALISATTYCITSCCSAGTNIPSTYGIHSSSVVRILHAIHPLNRSPSFLLVRMKRHVRLKLLRVKIKKWEEKQKNKAERRGEKRTFTVRTLRFVLLPLQLQFVLFDSYRESDVAGCLLPSLSLHFQTSLTFYKITSLTFYK